MKSPKSQNTLVILANANQLVANILRNVVGNDLADSIAGTPHTSDAVYNLTQSELQKTLSAHLGGK